MTLPSTTILFFTIIDTRTRMDRLEQCFRHMRIFDGVASLDDIDVYACDAPNSAHGVKRGVIFYFLFLNL